MVIGKNELCGLQKIALAQIVTGMIVRVPERTEISVEVQHPVQHPDLVIGLASKRSELCSREKHKLLIFDFTGIQRPERTLPKPYAEKHVFSAFPLHNFADL